MVLSGRVLRSGSQALRDAGVLLLSLCGLLPLWWLAPRATLLSLCAFFALFLTPLPRRLLRWLGQAGAGAGPAPTSVAVLAGGFRGDGALSPRSARRLRHGVALATRLGLPLRLCGGARHGPTSEAQALCQAARALGFTGPLSPEERSRTTLENLLALRDDPQGGAHLLVTCPQHAPRLRRLCRLVYGAGRAAPPRVEAYPVDWLPDDVRGRLTLAIECLYECAVHLHLGLRQLAVRARLLPPLAALRRPHLHPGAP